jgi:hypothetical protein
MLEATRHAVKRWWRGEPVDYNEPGSPLVFLTLHHRRRWTARLIASAWTYFVAHHQWIIGTVVIGILGLYVAAKFGH